MRNVKMPHRKMRQQNDGVDSTLDWEILQKRVQSEDGSSAVLVSGVPVVNIERCEWLLSRHQIKNETWSFIKKCRYAERQLWISTASASVGPLGLLACDNTSHTVCIKALESFDAAVCDDVQSWHKGASKLCRLLGLRLMRQTQIDTQAEIFKKT